MSKYTGPWQCVFEGVTVEVFTESDGTTILTWAFPAVAKPIASNARLIAAAPELLKAAGDFFGWFNSSYPAPSIHPDHEWNVLAKILSRIEYE